MQEFKIGSSAPRIEDRRLVTGSGLFLDDIRLPGMVFGCVVRSSHAHALLLGVDVSIAREMPGVLAILTASDYVDAGYASLRHLLASPHTRKDRGSFFPSKPPLAKDKLRFVGEPVAFVVAETAHQARDAAEFVNIHADALSPVLSLVDATDSKTPPVWDESPENICFVHESGDRAAVERAFHLAPHTISARFTIPRVAISPIETRGYLADHDSSRNFTTVYAGVQDVYTMRRCLAEAFGEPEAMFRIVSPDVGGSFGLKGFDAEAVLTVWASRKLGRPVKWFSDRNEAFLSDNHGRDNVSEAELALSANGTFLGLRVRTFASIGAYASSLASGPPVNNLGSLAGVYRTPAIFAEVIGVFTNKNPTGPYRGAGRPEASFVIERLVDLSARQLKFDPIELRRRNLIPPEAMPFRTGLTYTYDCGDFPAVMERAIAASASDCFEDRWRKALCRGRLLGQGVATVVERATITDTFETVEIRVLPSGSISVFCGSTDQGQGHRTMYAQIVCDRLGVDPGLVEVREADTLSLASGGMTGSSRVSAMGSAALLEAVRKIVDKGRGIAAHMLETAADDIVFRAGQFVVTGTDRSIDLNQVAAAAYQPSLLPPHIEPGWSATGTFRAGQENFPNACHVCEIEIDPETGGRTITRYVVVDDAGILINPMLAKGQIHGGLAQGIGEALMEEIVHDPESGQLVTGAFTDYAMPRASDLITFEIEDLGVPTSTNPLGVKGVGEAGTVGALPAVINAVIDALAPLGVTDIALPATSERIWRAIENAPVRVQDVIGMHEGRHKIRSTPQTMSYTGSGTS